MFTSSSLDYLGFQSFGNEEKLVALLAYSSFRLVATSGIRNSSVATSSTSFNSVSRAQIRSEYGVTPYYHSTAAQHSWNGFCDVTRLVATERVRNKYSLCC